MATKLNIRECPVCDSRICELVDAGPPRIVCCADCGMVFNDVTTDVDYSQSKYATGFEEWNQARYEGAAERIATLPGVSLDWWILDVGCATGGLMKCLKEHLFNNVFGIDPDPGCTRRAIEWGVNVCVGSLTGLSGAWPHPRYPYNCVILSHVLEHIRDVESAMQKLEQVAGSVYIEVPNALRYDEHVKSPYQNWNREHVNHFDLRHLTDLFQKHRFQLRCCGEYSCEPDNFPALWAWYTKVTSLKERAEEYGRVSADAMRRIEQQIAEIEGPVIAWGIGALARRLEPVVRIAHAFDQYQHGPWNQYCGKMVCNPEIIAVLPFPDAFAKLPILVTTILHKDSVLEQIKELRLKNRVITLGD